MSGNHVIVTPCNHFLDVADALTQIALKSEKRSRVCIIFDKFYRLFDLVPLKKLDALYPLNLAAAKKIAFEQKFGLESYLSMISELSFLPWAS